jgi:hypothetical protein
MQLRDSIDAADRLQLLVFYLIFARLDLGTFTNERFKIQRTIKSSCR